MINMEDFNKFSDEQKKYKRDIYNLCNYEAKKSCDSYSLYEKIVYLMNERDDFGYYGSTILLPHNLFRVNDCFESRYIENYIIKCFKKKYVPHNCNLEFNTKIE
jgi:hypothetical protein